LYPITVLDSKTILSFTLAKQNWLSQNYHSPSAGSFPVPFAEFETSLHKNNSCCHLAELTVFEKKKIKLYAFGLPDLSKVSSKIYFM
jgi:hypothetical protein